MKSFFLSLLIVFAFTAYGQSNNINSQTTKKQTKMDLSIISNKQVKNAIEALHANNLKVWYSSFEDKVVFTDDGRTLDFKSFFDNAFDKKEKFIDIDKVENDGKILYGKFYAGQWGTFRVYFKFHQNENGKFYGLDIGQAAK